MEKKDKIAMLEQSLDRKLTTLEMYENRPRKWILYLVIVLAVALLVGWSADDIHFTGLTATGTEVAKGVVHGVFHPDTNLLFGTGDSDVPYLLLQTIAIAVLGTIFGAILAIPFAFLASFNIMPKAVAYIVRILILMIRTIPSIVWALMWIRVTGPGAACGVITQSVWLDRHDLQNVHHGHRRSGYAHSRKSGRHGLHAVPENPLRRSAAADGKLHLDYDLPL